jgi:hypothetical protein
MPNTILRLKPRVIGSSPIAGMRGWYDASSDAYMTLSGALVTSWNDRSGNGYNAAPQVSSEPTRTLAGLNGLGVIDFTGSGSVSTNLLFTIDSTIRTVSCVFKGSSFLLTDSTTTYNFHRYQGNDTDPTVPLFDGPTTNNWASSNVYNGLVRINKGDWNAPATYTTLMPTALNNGWNLISIVTLGNVTANGFNRDRTYHSGPQSHAEMIIYDTALTLQEIIYNEDYLSTKWGLGL